MNIYPLTSFINRLSAHTLLSDEEHAVLLGLPRREEWVKADSSALKIGELAKTVCVITEGLLTRSTNTKDGRRQITSFYVSGEMPDLHTLMRPRSSFDLVAQCESQILRIPHIALRDAIHKHPAIGEAFSRELVHQSDVTAEWVVNVGQRPAKARIAHLFCEIAIKKGAVREQDTRFLLPVTQAALADATGLSAVHVNRSVQSLRHDKVLGFEHGEATIPNWDALVNIAGFDGAYLRVGEPDRLAS
jgi:CRP-like cAMP-binding protein